jgi:arylsulfatase A-like enzyme
MYIAPNQKFASDAVFLDGYDLKKAQNDQDTVRVTKGFNNFKRKGLSGKVPLFENAEVVEYPCNQKTLTKRYFKRAIDFIEKSKDQPFFVYITPAMPHVPLFPSEEFKGKSKRGLYGDVVEEIDYNLGQLMNSLKENGLDKNTIVMFASDNGPWLKFGDLGGSALPLRDGKGTIFEGGIRVPCIVSWPAKWQSGKESHEVVSSYDILPTIAGYAGIDTKNMILDGTNLAQHFENTNISTGNDTYLIFRGTKVSGIRKGQWKYLTNGGAYCSNQKQIDAQPAMLFNLKEDLAEENNVLDQFPDVAERLKGEIKSLKLKLAEQ